jgi:hypothetical protein
MRIIRVSGCHDCEPYAKWANLDDRICLHPKRPDGLSDINSFVKNKTLPDNCPLEEVEGVISYSPIMKRAKSSKPYFKPIRGIYHSWGRGKRSVY